MGSVRNVYNTGFQYDTEADRIKEAYCDCPAFRSYSGICKHCVAVLLEYGDRKAYERVEIRRQQDEEQKQAELFSGTAFPAALSGPGQPATKTTVELKSLLNRQLYSRMLPFSGDPYFGRVELETCLKFNSVRNCFTVEFRVGCEKKYMPFTYKKPSFICSAACQFAINTPSRNTSSSPVFIAWRTHFLVSSDVSLFIKPLITEKINSHTYT